MGTPAYKVTIHINTLYPSGAWWQAVIPIAFGSSFVIAAPSVLVAASFRLASCLGSLHSAATIPAAARV
ncbi:hypothetical protein [Solitalea lacus]|uniref:hypothetical protein n=1 Tax=Solitalea lacus TaxID=2911172 RepID=UPI001EDA0A4F|nr:hypothetical protein [Solitalea lacus]UKJ07917.1 hypothetical protein L2B55_01835 [Solitalea lacus]